MLPFLNECLHSKNQGDRCIPFRCIDDHRIQQPDWTRVFCPIICDAKFSRYQVFAVVRSVCFFHFILGHIHETLSRVLLGRKKSNFGQTPKFYPQMYILQIRRQVSWVKKKISQISLSYSSLKRSCSTDKSLKKQYLYFLFFKSY